MTRYWVHRDGRQLGPFDEAQILDDYARGVLRPSDQLWSEGMQSRVPVADTVALLQAAAARSLDPAAARMPPPISNPQARRIATESEYAGFWVRWCAAGIDASIVCTVGGALAFGPDLVRLLVLRAAPETPFLVLGIPISVAIAWLYFAGLESGRSRATLGKRAMGLEVRRAGGLEQIGFGRASVRWLAHWVSFALLLGGFLMQPFTPRRQALHDLVSGTVVVVATPREPALVVALSLGFVLLVGPLVAGVLTGAVLRALEMYAR